MTRTLQPGQVTQVLLGGPRHPTPEPLFTSSEVLFEAPNWALDGGSLLLNGDGALWRLGLEAGATPEPIDFDGLPPINNDHVLDPDGEHVFLTADDRHVYRGALSGGGVECVTPDDGAWHFLHGVSPDGRSIAYVGITDLDAPGRLAVLDLATGDLEHPDTGPGHLDGPEWSPDGGRILFNTESLSTEPGHAQLASIPAAGGALTRLVVSDTVDWFPHLSPDGAWGSYVAFPAGTLGHPADREVVVHVVAAEDWTTPLQSYPLLGGQGTFNVNSWAPRGDRFAFVAYPSA
jgi:TolB protein